MGQDEKEINRRLNKAKSIPTTATEEERKKKLDGDRFALDTTLRLVLCIWVGGVITLWLGYVAMIVMLQSELENSVLITLLGSTTLNTLVLGRIVLKGLFPSSTSNK